MHYLYTHNDLDGVGCGIVAKCAFGGQVEVRYNSVDGLNAQVERFLEKWKGKEKQAGKQRLFITDLAVNERNEQTLNAYAASGGKIRLIDHHKTALHLNRHDWGRVNVRYEDGRLASATSLFYDELLKLGLLAPSPALDEFVELVRQYDTWEWEQNGNQQAKRLNDLFSLVSIEEFEEKMVGRLQAGEPFAFDEFEEKLLDLEEEKIERYLRRKRREMVQTFVHDRCVGVVHAESYHSELGNELGKENPHLDYIAILNMGGKRISFRTIHDDVDVSRIAGRFGGGGHAKAAGCTMSGEVYRRYVAETFPLEPLPPDAARNRYNLKESAYGTLYENREEERFFLFSADGAWHIDRDGETLADAFPTFAAGERHLKREHAAWLVRDEAYIEFLLDEEKRSRPQAAAIARETL